MAGVQSLRTERLLLQRWRPSDREPFAHLNADPIVMEHFPATLSRSESDAFVARIQAGFDQRGYGLWAVEVPGGSDFIGYVGLAYHDFPAHFTPAVEIGWRIDRPFGARVTRSKARVPWSRTDSSESAWKRSFPSLCRPTSAPDG